MNVLEIVKGAQEVAKRHGVVAHEVDVAADGIQVAFVQADASVAPMYVVATITMKQMRRQTWWTEFVREMDRSAMNLVAKLALPADAVVMEIGAPCPHHQGARIDVIKFGRTFVCEDAARTVVLHTEWPANAFVMNDGRYVAEPRSEP